MSLQDGPREWGLNKRAVFLFNIGTVNTRISDLLVNRIHDKTFGAGPIGGMLTADHTTNRQGGTQRGRRESTKSSRQAGRGSKRGQMSVAA